MNRHDDLRPMRIHRQWKNQKGMTGIAIAGLLILGAFLALIAMRLFPVYLEHMSVTSHLENLAVDEEMKGKLTEDPEFSSPRARRADAEKAAQEHQLQLQEE